MIASQMLVNLQPRSSIFASTEGSTADLRSAKNSFQLFTEPCPERNHLEEISNCCESSHSVNERRTRRRGISSNGEPQDSQVGFQPIVRRSISMVQEGSQIPFRDDKKKRRDRNRMKGKGV